ncbi:UDP-4-amino-4,6-dideoxy-N-acetyl-beta-L-altrosamine N-acetyltransferase [Oceanobacillus saliphilus]|uniref:UDP-4-amino-4, 6-dideoxy-N-acetyl-beta-L-altrosamine N-acetyltransferase n=1 Tax=Oceanobacillus saliphilus TaxID=2925834 RepID=UPI00201DE1B4|nr:UDP-4-amino-4,6-dideoxy-N-acetyl-beta-L-altrosamine N-acetyltransferase [Oceanobacillus saliphilus]
MSIWDRVSLETINDIDLQMVLSWRNQDFVRRMMYNSEIISKKEHLEWFARIQNSNTSIAKIFYFENQPYGVVNIHQIDYTNRTCEWSFYIGEKGAPSGLGTILGYLAIDYIFNRLHLRKLCAEVIEFNYKSYHFHKKFGFEEEGLLKEHIKKEGKYVDIYLFGLFKSNWLEQSNQLKEQIEIKFIGQ